MVDRCSASVLLKLLLLSIFSLGAAPAMAVVGDSRSYIAHHQAGPGQVIKAWIQGRRAGNRFLSIRRDAAGGILSVCSEASPVPPGALYAPKSYSDQIATLTMNLLLRKGHGRTLAGFWDTPAGRSLARRLEAGDIPGPCS